MSIFMRFLIVLQWMLLWIVHQVDQSFIILGQKIHRRMIGKLMDIDGDSVVPQKNRKCGSGLCDRLYFQIYDGPKTWSKLFTRMVYSRKDRSNSVVIQYTGDENVAADFPHGNDKKTTRNYIRTQPSVLRAIQSTSTESPMEVYRSMVR